MSTKELLLLLLNMQNKWYTRQLFSPPNNQLLSQSLSSNCPACGIHRAHDFHAFCRTRKVHKTHQVTEKRQNSWKRLELIEKGLNSRKKDFLPPSHYPFIYLAWRLWYGIFPLASLA